MVADLEQAMEEDSRMRHERALHTAEVRLWVEERELALLSGREPAGTRDDLEREILRLRELVDEERDWLQEHPVAPRPRPLLGQGI